MRLANGQLVLPCDHPRHARFSHLQGNVLERAVPEGRPQAHLGHLFPQVVVLFQAPVPYEIITLRLHLPATGRALSSI